MKILICIGLVIAVLVVVVIAGFIRQVSRDGWEQ